VADGQRRANPRHDLDGGCAAGASSAIVDRRSLVRANARSAELHRRALRSVVAAGRSEAGDLDTRSPYRESYDLDPTDAMARPDYERFSRFVRELRRFAAGARLVFLRSLLGDGIERETLHRLFAAVRWEVARTAGAAAAFYSPLGSTGKKAGRFEPHADLYGPPMLLNVFLNFPTDGSGASTFVNRRALVRALRSSPEVPKGVTDRIERYFTSASRRDRFDGLFDLLHDPANRWHDVVERLLDRLRVAVAFRRGEGYLLNDRAGCTGAKLRPAACRATASTDWSSIPEVVAVIANREPRHGGLEMLPAALVFHAG